MGLQVDPCRSTCGVYGKAIAQENGNYECYKENYEWYRVVQKESTSTLENNIIIN